MQLSVIIINYNVKYFLEQCLCSVQKAIIEISGKVSSEKAEVIVIDNCSFDSSVDYLKPKFQDVLFVTNKENIGFAKACNQGAKIAKGKYILFLNPDTIVPEDCFQKCISFLASHEDAGAMGIKMLDGSGKFLKESKRSFPSPMTSLYKLSGLAKIFPRSKWFSKYHLGYLDKNGNHEIDVLAGAYIMVKKEVLEKIGGLDEVFFMYGEDVDLSYRIQKAGYKNYYFSETSIIHFKGESTRKGTLNYVRLFYKAMSVFVSKHYGRRKAGLFSFLIHLAIWIRAAMAAIASFIRRVGLPLIDAGLILLSFWLIKNLWSNYIRTEIQYENKLLWMSFPIFTTVFLVVSYYTGLYDRWYKGSKLVRSAFIATIVLLAGYSLLPEQYRFSRAIILFSPLLSFFLINIVRLILIHTKVLAGSKEKEEHANTLIVASQQEFSEIVALMNGAGLQERILGRLSVNEKDLSAIGYWKEIKTLAATIPFREVIFCEGTIPFREIIESIQQLPRHIHIKFHTAGSHSIVGSDSKDSSGEALTKEKGYKLSDPYNLRLKRFIDVSVSLLALTTFPIQFFLTNKPIGFLVNCFYVLFGKRTWIGYASGEKNLPHLRKGIIACNAAPLSAKQSLSAESLKIVDLWYARDYEPLKDLRMIIKKYRTLGA